MGKIQIKYENIAEVLKGMQVASAKLNRNFPESLFEGNQLDTINELKDINESFEKLIENYKNLLHKNQLMVTQSVALMKETDNNLKSAMSVNSVIQK
ncbi:DUF5344 family protein [Fictibacillus iocasae]|uniref:DUF5344 family protein n=1 Tax=Fictibacillus iocasae TaxID=2715437 RepID=A0ABW2NPJ9_9BACL